jgi:hypothetical protein
MKPRIMVRAGELQPEELQWLTGTPQPGANPFSQHVRGARKVERCRQLLAEHAHLVPPGRRARLLEDLAHWARPHL